MRHIPIAEDELHRRIEAAHPGWLANAAARTQALRSAGKYEETSSIWAEIKPVYRALQHDKCAFCERKLEGGTYGSVEQDLEHFRPKGPVPTWPTPQIAAARKIRYRFSTGPALARGYHLLAYAPLNYAVACKPCNIPLKANFFPILGKRCRALSDDVSRYRGESPCLVYPLGDVDEPPETLLTFAGLVPVPVATRGPRLRRARVLIDFFELDTREGLLRERADVVTKIYLARKLAAGDPSAARVLDYHRSPASPHTTCARAFDDLHRRDPAAARRYYDAAAGFLDSLRPPP